MTLPAPIAGAPTVTADQFPPVTPALRASSKSVVVEPLRGVLHTLTVLLAPASGCPTISMSAVATACGHAPTATTVLVTV